MIFINADLPVANGYKYRVDFEKVFIEGALNGLVLRDSLHFVTKSDAIFFAKRDGLIVSAYGGDDYRQDNSQIITL